MMMIGKNKVCQPV